ncbi:MAG: hypothetical protein KHX45_20825 [Clostridiales bacterium]|nr:hypothetical protein [Clostridiales bacterium]DAJ91065.1 MAG TPA: hypothetical protein [Caudoviricetes sp.]
MLNTVKRIEREMNKVTTKRERTKPIVEIEFTPGYEQRLTRAILKIYEKREREALEAEKMKEVVSVG